MKLRISALFFCLQLAVSLSAADLSTAPPEELLRLYQQLRSLQGSDQGAVAENVDWKRDAATFTFAPSASSDASLWRRALDFRNQEGTGGAHGRLAHEELLPEGMAETHPASGDRGVRPCYNTPPLADIRRAMFMPVREGRQI